MNNDKIKKWFKTNNITAFRWNYTKKGYYVQPIHQTKKYFVFDKTEIEKKIINKDNLLSQGNFCATDDYRSLGCNFWKNHA